MKLFAVLLIIVLFVACSAPRYQSSQQDYQVMILGYGTGAYMCRSEQGSYATAQLNTGQRLTFCAFSGQYQTGVWLRATASNVQFWLRNPVK